MHPAGFEGDGVRRRASCLVALAVGSSGACIGNAAVQSELEERGTVGPVGPADQGAGSVCGIVRAEAALQRPVGWQPERHPVETGVVGQGHDLVRPTVCLEAAPHGGVQGIEGEGRRPDDAGVDALTVQPVAIDLGPQFLAGIPAAVAVPVPVVHTAGSVRVDTAAAVEGGPTARLTGVEAGVHFGIEALSVGPAVVVRPYVCLGAPHPVPAVAAEPDAVLCARNAGRGGPGPGSELAVVSESVVVAVRPARVCSGLLFDPVVQPVSVGVFRVVGDTVPVGVGVVGPRTGEILVEVIELVTVGVEHGVVGVQRVPAVVELPQVRQSVAVRVGVFPLGCLDRDGHRAGGTRGCCVAVGYLVREGVGHREVKVGPLGEAELVHDPVARDERGCATGGLCGAAHDPHRVAIQVEVVVEHRDDHRAVIGMGRDRVVVGRRRVRDRRYDDGHGTRGGVVGLPVGDGVAEAIDTVESGGRRVDDAGTGHHCRAVVRGVGDAPVRVKGDRAAGDGVVGQHVDGDGGAFRCGCPVVLGIGRSRG